MTAQVIPFPPMLTIWCYDGEFTWPIPLTETRDPHQANEWLEEYKLTAQGTYLMFWIEAK